MTLKGETKFKGKPTCGLKNDIRNLVNFHASSKKSKNLHFDGLLLSKAFAVLDEKVQKSYFSWRWRVIQSLTKSWVLVPKMTWEIEWILMWAVASLKICNLMLILSKVHCLWAKKSTEELCVIKLENDCKIWKITWALKSYMRNLANFDPTLESLKICLLMSSFRPKYIMVELKNYRAVTFHDTEGWCNI